MEERPGRRGHEESSAPRASFACTRDVVTHVVLLCPVSHVNLRPRAAEGRDGEEGRERERAVRERLTLNRRIGGVLHGLKCPFLGLTRCV